MNFNADISASSRVSFPPSEPEQMQLGQLSLYCESFRAVCIRNFREEVTVSGKTVSAGCNKKGTRLTITGRIVDEVKSMRPLLYLSSIMDSNTAVEVPYKTVKFESCRIQSIDVLDECSGYITAKIVLVTYESPGERTVSQ